MTTFLLDHEVKDIIEADPSGLLDADMVRLVEQRVLARLRIAKPPLFTEDDIPEPVRSGRAEWNATVTKAGMKLPQFNSADNYFATCIASAANWFSTRSGQRIAVESGCGELMKQYAEVLDIAAEKIKHPEGEPTPD
jgi:hypothetical protein